MHMPRFLLPVGLVVALGAMPATSLAGKTPGDNGLPPTNAAQCQAKVKGVDDALKSENDNWDKLSGRKLGLRATLQKKIATAQANMADLKAQMDALKPQMDAAQAAYDADPSLQEQFLDIQNQYFVLQQDF